MSSLTRITTTFLLLLGLGQPLAVAQSLEDVKVGVGGRVKLGHWTMLQVTVKDPGAATQLRARTRDGDGTEVVYRFGVRPTGGRMTQYVKWGRVESRLQLELVDNSGKVLTTKRVPLPSPPLPSTHRIILSTGKKPKLGGAISFAETGDNWQGAHSEVSDLPDRWHGYDSVHTLVMTTSQANTTTSLSESQFTALERWVRMGGRFILVAGSQGAEVFGKTSRFKRFLPGDFKGVVEQTRTEKIETYAAAKSPLDRVVGIDDEFKFQVSLLENLKADVYLYETAGTQGERPLISQHSYGFGRVVIVSFDLDNNLFQRWEAYDNLVYQILSLTLRGGTEQIAKGGRASHVGYEDLMGQLRGALDQFAGVETIPFSVVAVLIISYVVLIGPVDYFLLRRLGWQRLTWVTLPVVTIAFCCISVWLYQTSKSERSRVNQVDLVDVDINTGTVRGTSWFHVYSSKADAYDIDLGVSPFTTVIDPRKAKKLLSWHGMPGSGLGGLSNPTFSPGGESSYSISRSEGIHRMPIHIAGSKSLVGRWWAKKKFSTSAIQLKANREGTLDGKVTWPLDVEFEESILLYQNWAYYIRFPLKKGTEVLMRELPTPKHFDWRLTRRYTVDARNVTTPWDTSDISDLPRIMEIMMFYKIAGGRNYTKLSHRYQSFVDLSDQLTSRNAIVFGRVKNRATYLSAVSSQSAKSTIRETPNDRAWTFYRVIVPVQGR